MQHHLACVRGILVNHGAIPPPPILRLHISIVATFVEKKPKEKLSEAIEGAIAVEDALSFHKEHASSKLKPAVNALHRLCAAPEK